MKAGDNRTTIDSSSNKEPANLQAPARFFQKYQIILLSFVIEALVFILWQCKDIQPLPMWDGTYYIRYSLNSVFPPVYPLLIIIARTVLPTGVLAAEVVSIFFLCASVVAVFYLAKHFTTTCWAFAAAIFAGFNPLSIRLGTETLSEATYLFFILLALLLYAGTLATSEKPWHLYSVGISLSIAYFTRPEAVVLLVALLTIYYLKRKNLRRLLLLAGGFASVLFLVVLGIYTATGDVVITRKTVNFRVMDPTNWVANETRQESQSLSAITRSTLQNYPTNFLDEASNLIKFVGVPAILLALYYLFKKKTFLIAALAEFFVYPVFTGLALPERFVYPYIPVFGILAVASISNYAPKNTRLVLLILFLGGTLTGFSVLTTIQEPFPEQIAAGITLKPFVNHNTIILDRKPYSCFYAGLSPEYNYEPIPPSQPIDSVIHYAELTHANYLVLDRPIIRIFRPELEPLFDPSVRSRYARKLQLFRDIFPDKAFEVLIFKVL